MGQFTKIYKLNYFSFIVATFKCFLFCFLLFDAPITLFAQETLISVSLIDKKQQPISHATVMLKNTLNRVIIFTTNDVNGKYKLVLPDSANRVNITLEINLLGYKEIQTLVVANKMNYEFTLEEVPIDLKVVEIKNKPQIITLGDTLSYDVASFSRPEDRSIGDVIKRLPGVSVAENGQISYNGKAISNLYIHGDDLMDGRYGLATKVITKEMIKSVDVIQHHQPIKVLKDKIFTNDVAMNLVLKDENSLKLGGQVMIGGGFPRQFDEALNTMMFNKKFKMLNSIKANNSGIDYNNDFAKLGTSNFVSNVSNKTPSSLLSSATTNNPDLPKNNYYFNKSGITNVNNLFNFKSGLQLKSNIQVFLDKNTQNNSSLIATYLPKDTITYNELQQSTNKPYIVNAAFTAMANKDTYFLNNKFSLNFSGYDNLSTLNFNGNGFNQLLNQNTKDFSNDLSFTPALKNKNVIDLRWYLSYYNNPQNLFVASGLNSDILNNSIPYYGINQYVKMPTFFNSISLAYRVLNDKLIKQNYQAGILNERQQLNSVLNLTQLNGSATKYEGDVGNDLNWQRDRVFANADYYVKKVNWNLNLSIPIIGQSIRYKQAAYELNVTKNQLFINPNLNFRLFFNAEDYLLANYTLSNSVGNIANVYRGVIASNYRSVSTNATDLQELSSSGSSLSYNFQRSIIMLFINASINFKKVTANSILSSVLTNNIQRTVLLPFENDQSSINASTSFSKYIFALKTTASLKSSWNRTNYNQFINNQQLPFINDSFGLNLGIDSKIFGRITFSYNGNANWNASKQKYSSVTTVNLSNKAKRLDQNFSLGYSPINNLYLTLQSRHIYSDQANISKINYLFVDTKMRYKLVKWRTDFEFDITNIANLKNYEVFGLSSNQLVISKYDIRGRMAILRATFNL